MGLFDFLKGDSLGKIKAIVGEINSKEDNFRSLSDEALLAKSLELKKIAAEADSDVSVGVNLDDLAPEAFALAREAARRTLGQRPFDSQLIGGLVLHQGKIDEMMTGEGKTLAAVAPAYLNALTGKGVHVITVNDYLAKRDAIWMGQIYDFLGMKVACLVHDAAYIYDPSFKPLPTEEKAELDEKRDVVGGFRVVSEFLRPVGRQEAYLADVVYGTNHEFGFDYLRDNLTGSLSDRVQRSCYYAIIDEVDSILIDEARTPLIIAAPDSQSSNLYKLFFQIASQLTAEKDYEVDEKKRTVNLTDDGINYVEKALKIENIFAPENLRLVHFLQESLKAKALFLRDRNYVVKDGEVVIVDEFTGRLMWGRRYSGGLHQAIEAKENVLVQQENRTFAQVTIQNYFRMYEKIAGMTGTAQTSAEEFHKVYKLDTVSIPPNKPMVRQDMPDLIYKTKDGKYKAIAEEVKKRHAVGQPVLIGTTSISNNEIISDYLRRVGIPHEVLNAKNHEREGEIIAQAGRVGAVTVATNMAGRGVDIILGGNPVDPIEAEKVRQAGGLHVIGTERHEARRIDNQLRGRSGRQGDPGSSQFFLSLKDDLLRIFGGDRVKTLMETLKMPEDMPIEAGLISRVVAQAQQKVEGMNFDARRHLLDFDDVLNKQREAIYRRRTAFLMAGQNGDLKPQLEELLGRYEERLRQKLASEPISEQEDKEESVWEKELAQLTKIKGQLTTWQEKEDLPRSGAVASFLIRLIDGFWVDHLENLEHLRESVNLRAYGQHEPLVEYRRDAFMFYQILNDNVEDFLAANLEKLLTADLVRNDQARKPFDAAQGKENKVGRNDPCPCGSNKKYKKCHGV
ncbi:MAG: preprotein translocase subunit SecA [bacterium]|nr:preprotein translocase subunit SecA [bacterium]